MFQTEAYDIFFGFYRARDSESTYEILNEGEEGQESIDHPTNQLEEIFPLQVIECSENMVRITFIAKETGFYKLLFSNEHSWIRAKNLKFRYVVLKPLSNEIQCDPLASKENAGLIHNDPEKKLSFRIMDKLNIFE